MTRRTRKILATAAGLIFVLVGIIISILGHFIVAVIGDGLVAPNSIPGWSVPQENSNFYAFFILVLCISSGLSITAFLWSPRPGYSIRVAIYVLLLLTILPVATFNYAHADFLVNRSAQAVFNLILIFCGAVVVTELFSFRPSSRDLLILQVLAVLSLSLTAVFIPATFSVIWLLNALGVISEASARSLGIPTISTISGVLSTTVAFLKFRREMAA